MWKVPGSHLWQLPLNVKITIGSLDIYRWPKKFCTGICGGGTVLPSPRYTDFRMPSVLRACQGRFWLGSVESLPTTGCTISIYIIAVKSLTCEGNTSLWKQKNKKNGDARSHRKIHSQSGKNRVFCVSARQNNVNAGNTILRTLS